jgi:hypothetical protein
MMKDVLRVSARMFAIAVTGIGSALAADMYRAPEPVVGGYNNDPVYGPVTSWTGFYLGVNGAMAGVRKTAPCPQ